MSAVTRDQNDRILNLIKDRMELGIERYGHGLRTSDDTRQWGTRHNSWCEMALEEVLDGMVYMAAQIIRIQDTMRIFPTETPNSTPTTNTDQEDIFNEYDNIVVQPGELHIPDDTSPINIQISPSGRAPFLSPTPSYFLDGLENQV